MKLIVALRRVGRCRSRSNEVTTGDKHRSENAKENSRREKQTDQVGSDVFQVDLLIFDSIDSNRRQISVKQTIGFVDERCRVSISQNLLVRLTIRENVRPRFLRLRFGIDR